MLLEARGSRQPRHDRLLAPGTQDRGSDANRRAHPYPAMRSDSGPATLRRKEAI